MGWGKQQQQKAHNLHAWPPFVLCPPTETEIGNSIDQLCEELNLSRFHILKSWLVNKLHILQKENKFC